MVFWGHGRAILRSTPLRSSPPDSRRALEALRRINSGLWRHDRNQNSSNDLSVSWTTSELCTTLGSVCCFSTFFLFRFVTNCGASECMLVEPLCRRPFGIGASFFFVVCFGNLFLLSMKHVDGLVAFFSVSFPFVLRRRPRTKKKWLKRLQEMLFLPRNCALFYLLVDVGWLNGNFLEGKRKKAIRTDRGGGDFILNVAKFGGGWDWKERKETLAREDRQKGQLGSCQSSSALNVTQLPNSPLIVLMNGTVFPP